MKRISTTELAILVGVPIGLITEWLSHDPAVAAHHWPAWSTWGNLAACLGVYLSVAGLGLWLRHRSRSKGRRIAG